MSNTRTIISGLNEDGLRVKVLIPLLRALGCIKVEDWQGNQENGIDVYFACKDVLGATHHCAIFIKVGDIKKSGKTDITKYEGQLREAFLNPFTNPLDGAARVSAGLVYLAFNGVMNKPAKDYFSEVLEHQFPGRIRILDIDMISYLVDVELPGRPNWPAGYEFALETFEDICNKLQSRPLDFLLSDTKEGASL